MSGFDLRELGWTPELAVSLDPNHLPGRVAVQQRGEYLVYTELGELRARLPGRLLRGDVVASVGDWVALDGETIAAVLPRRSTITRNAAGRETRAQVLAANVDVAFVVSSLGPDIEPRRLERYLATAWASGAAPVVVLTKSDLHRDAAEQALAVEQIAIGAPVLLASGVTGEGCDAVRAHVRAGTTAVLLGSSGVGKSTLANRLAGAELLPTRAVRVSDGEGRHTTTHRQLVLLPDGGMLVDTPGLRELQLWDTGSSGVDRAFAEVEELAASCRFADCAHTSEPGCAVLAAVDAGALPLDRVRSWRKLQRELLWQAARQGDEQARRARRRELRELARAQRRGRR